MSAKTELHSLLVTVEEAVTAGDHRRALRYADRAWRRAPLSRDVGLLYGQLLLTIGDHQGAIAAFEAISNRQPDLAADTAIVQALLASERGKEARDQIGFTLDRFAIAINTPLAKAARQIVRPRRIETSGWVGIDTSLEIIGEVIGGGPVMRLEILNPEGRVLDDRLVIAHDQEFTPFHIAPLPVRNPTPLTVRVNGAAIIGSGITYPPDFRLDGRAEVDDGTISGWISLGWAPQLPIEMTATVWDKLKIRVPTTPDEADGGKRNFTFRLPIGRLLGDRIDLAAMMPNGKPQPLPDSPLLLSGIKEFKRSSAGTALSRARRFFRPRSKSTDDPASKTLTIVVPVYKGRDETLGCIRSVLETIGSSHRLLIIDDATPEAGLVEILDTFAEAANVTLLRNSKNIGFPASVNRAFSHLSGGSDDIVILNADAMVFSDWLSRLQEAAYAEPDIGTVTPFSNSGSIANYPGGDDTDCDEALARRLDEIAAETNAGKRIDIPTAVGFCMYIRRACLDAAGPFDETLFDKGYGEENDFCLRASALGWRHILAANIFVRHFGSRSFGTRRQALMDRNRRILNQRHPGYDETIARFIATDPIHAARRILDETRLAARQDRFVLVITLALSGGVERFVRYRKAALNERGLTPILLKPDADHAGGCVLMPDGDDRLTDLSYDLASELDGIIEFLRGLAIDHIEIHHFLDLDPAFIDACTRLPVPIDIYIHDHSWVCPRLTLLGGDGKYCGEPAIEDCEACIVTNGTGLEEGLTVTALRQRSNEWLSQARQVFVSSVDMSRRLKRYFPELHPTIVTWEEPVERLSRPAAEWTDRARVVLIGAIGQQKGYNVLLDCAGDAAQRDLPLDFTIIGFTEDDQTLIDTGRVFITGRYEESEIQTLLGREDPHLAFFSSVTPEGWCYALTHALNARLPVAAFDLGVVAERLRADPDTLSLLLPVTTEAADINDHILTFIKRIYRDSQQDNETGSRSLALLPSLSDTVQPGLLAVSGHGNPQYNVDKTSFPREPMQEPRTELTASVDTLTLAKGMYLFTVRSASPAAVGEEGDLILPAIHVGAAPGLQSDNIEFMSGRKTGTWLYDRKDLLVAKVSAGPATILITSIRAPGMAPLSIDVQRLDNRSASMPQAQQQLPQQAPSVIIPPPPLQGSALSRTNGAGSFSGASGKRPIRLQIVAHIQRRGDMPFTDTPWAGYVGQRLPIEAFSITPLEAILSDQLEYKALAANGTETGWISGGGLCGSRRQALPLIGFAIRVKPQQGMNHFDCEYSGAFISGAINGPFKNGAPCYASETDHLEAIQVSISPRQDTQWQGSGNGMNIAPDLASIEKPAERRPIGPRFSIFRETAESSEG